MQEQAKNQFYQKLLEYMENTQDFVLEQAPEVMQQALKYEKTAAVVSATTMLVLLITMLCLALYFGMTPTLDNYGARTLLSTFGVFIPLIVVIPCFGQFYHSIDRLIKIYIAPKYFLINLIMNLKK